VPRTRPAWSTRPATCTSAWVSTPPVTSRACPASAIVGMSSPFSATDWDGTAGPGTDGQSTSGTTEVGLLSGHGRPGPGGLHILPSDPGRRFVIRTRSRGQLSEGPGRGPAAGRAKPRRTKLRITAETPERSNPQPHLPHSGEVLSDGEGRGERAPSRRSAWLTWTWGVIPRRYGCGRSARASWRRVCTGLGEPRACRFLAGLRWPSSVMPVVMPGGSTPCLEEVQ
jgi:hypothetical protein